MMPEMKKNQASLAYSFRQPDDAAYSEESKSFILSDGDDTTTNGNNGGSSLDNDEMDIVGPGTLGDIMSGTSDATQITTTTKSSSRSTLSPTTSDNPSSSKLIDGLVTKEGGELNTRFNCNFSPMERIALTSNGNLQRIFSSYYDAPVHVHIDFCERRTSNANNSGDGSSKFVDCNGTGTYNNFDVKKYYPQKGENNNTSGAIWDRIVHIHIHGQTICKATSIISVKDPVCIRLIENGTIGLGQLFRYLNRLPTFSLVDAGRSRTINDSSSSSSTSSSSDNNNDALFDGGIWRTYELKCEEMACLIHEEFHKDAWNIPPSESNGGGSTFQPMI
jgi:hypothetical protein